MILARFSRFASAWRAIARFMVSGSVSADGGAWSPDQGPFGEGSRVDVLATPYSEGR